MYCRVQPAVDAVSAAVSAARTQAEQEQRKVNEHVS
jgi:hypothetical protein